MKAVLQYEVTGYPTIVFASSDGGMIAKHIGLISPKDFEPVIEGVLAKEVAFKEKLAELQETPDDAKLNAQVAHTYLERTQLEKAIPFTEEAFKHDPRNTTGLLPELHNRLGLAYGTMVESVMVRDPEKAEMYYEKAVSHFTIVIDKYPKSEANEHAQYYLGVTHAVKGNFDDAISLLEKLANHATDGNVKRNAEVMLERVKDLANAN